MSQHTTLYLPKDLKKQIVKTARDAGFKVGRGRKSRLVKFVEEILRTYQCTTQGASATLVSGHLVPELRSSVSKLSTLSASQQERASAMLEILFAEWEDRETQSSA